MRFVVEARGAGCSRTTGARAVAVLNSAIRNRVAYQLGLDAGGTCWPGVDLWAGGNRAVRPRCAACAVSWVAQGARRSAVRMSWSALVIDTPHPLSGSPLAAGRVGDAQGPVIRARVAQDHPVRLPCPCAGLPVV